VLRFPNSQISQEPEAVLADILAAATPHPALRATFSHKGRRTLWVDGAHFRKVLFRRGWLRPPGL